MTPDEIAAIQERAKQCDFERFNGNECIEKLCRALLAEKAENERLRAQLADSHAQRLNLAEGFGKAMGEADSARAVSERLRGEVMSYRSALEGTVAERDDYSLRLAKQEYETQELHGENDLYYKALVEIELIASRSHEQLCVPFMKCNRHAPECVYAEIHEVIRAALEAKEARK